MSYLPLVVSKTSAETSSEQSAAAMIEATAIFQTDFCMSRFLNRILVALNVMFRRTRPNFLRGSSLPISLGFGVQCCFVLMVAYEPLPTQLRLRRNCCNIRHDLMARQYQARNKLGLARFHPTHR